jgi:acetyl-CoA carboxylase biotin carboxyl carrier protein
MGQERGVVVSDGLSEGLNALKEEDVQRLARLIECLEASKFDYLQVQVGDMKVTLGKGALPTSAAAIVTPETPAYSPPPRPAPVAEAAPAPVQPAPSAKRAANSAPAGTIEIKAQIMGMFYAQPEPGSPPFVAVGAEVKADTTVCLIEVMKTFNAMTAGVKGVITEICVENSQMVEYGQVLFRVRPS